MKKKVYNVPVELDDRQREQLAGLEALYRLHLNYTDDEDTQCCQSVNGKIRYVDYPTSFLMTLMRLAIALPDGVSFDSEVKSERVMHGGALFEKGRKEEVLSVFRAYPSLIFEGEEGLLADLQMVEEPKALSAILDGHYWLYQLERDGEAGDVPTRNPAPEAAPDEATPMDENTISVRLTDQQAGKLVDLTIAHNVVNEVNGVTPDWTTQDSLAVFLRSENLDEEIELVRSLLDKPQSERDGEAGDVPMRNPAPDEESETMISVRDASGAVREVTLDEAEAMREAAQGIYAGEPPEPQMDDNSEVYFSLLEASRV